MDIFQEHIDILKLKSKCIHCGREIPFDANFCPYCRKVLKRDKSQELIRRHKFYEEIHEELEKKKRKKDVNN